MNRLTDEQLAAMRPDPSLPWIPYDMIVAAPAMYAELIERRAQDGIVLEMVETLKELLEEGSAEFYASVIELDSYNSEIDGVEWEKRARAAVAPYREKTDAAE